MKSEKERQNTAAMAQFNQSVAAELIAWGDARNVEVKKEGK